jgi:hypothetical protein
MVRVTVGRHIISLLIDMVWTSPVPLLSSTLEWASTVLNYTMSYLQALIYGVAIDNYTANLQSQHVGCKRMCALARKQ